MRSFPSFSSCFFACRVVAAASVTPQERVYEHVQDQANSTFREPSGILKFKYVVPAGPYDALWDWDSMFTGLALLEFGSAPYLEGSMLNFLDHTNVTDGTVGGCLKPAGNTGAIAQAKPIVIQGSWLAAKNTGGYAKFRPFADAMAAQLRYWSSAPRFDEATGLRVWHDQMESGADNLVLSTCASWMSIECLGHFNRKIHTLVLSSADLMTFLHREYSAFAFFNLHWAAEETDGATKVALMAAAAVAQQQAEQVKAALNTKLWSDDFGTYVAFNRSAGDPHIVTNRVVVSGYPLWGQLSSQEQAASVKEQLWRDDMLTPWGLRSVSSQDPRYENGNYINPYSNWRGPVWVNSNILLSYGLMHYGFAEEARLLADRVVDMLAADLDDTGVWHECYHSEKGEGLAAPSFLSWNTLAATWHMHLGRGEDPFDLTPLPSGVKVVV